MANSKPSNKTKPSPEYCRGKKKSHPILEDLKTATSILLNVHDHWQKKKKEKEKPQHPETCTFTHLYVNNSLDALE